MAVLLTELYQSYYKGMAVLVLTELYQSYYKGMAVLVLTELYQSYYKGTVSPPPCPLLPSHRSPDRTVTQQYSSLQSVHSSYTHQRLPNRTDCYCYNTHRHEIVCTQACCSIQHRSPDETVTQQYSMIVTNVRGQCIPNLNMVLTQVNGYPTEPTVTVTYDIHCRGSVHT